MVIQTDCDITTVIFGVGEVWGVVEMPLWLYYSSRPCDCLWLWWWLRMIRLLILVVMANLGGNTILVISLIDGLHNSVEFVFGLM